MFAMPAAAAAKDYGKGKVKPRQAIAARGEARPAVIAIDGE